MCPSANRLNLRRGHTGAAHADHVHAAHAVHILHHPERRNVLAAGRGTAEEGEPPDAAELVNRRVPGQEDAIARFDVPAEQRTVREDAVISDEAIVAAFERFEGVKRRFTKVGEAEGAIVIDDYAHHPTEIRAVLAAAREGADGRVLREGLLP